MKKRISLMIIAVFLINLITLTPVMAGHAVNVTSPNGGEVWEAGSTYTIHWSRDFDVKSTTVFASTDSGDTWFALGTQTTDIKSIGWLVPTTINTTKARIKVSATDNNNITYTDISDEDFTIKPPGPLAPTMLSAELLGSSAVKVTWADNSTDETGFYVYRRTGSGSYTKIATLVFNSTLYVDHNGIAGETYTYKVAAYNPKGTVNSTNSKSITMPTPLTAPTNLKAEAISSSKINLTWNDNSSNELGFIIFRKVAGEGYSQIKTVGAGVSSYSDTGLEPGTTYTYKVQAVNNGSTATSNVTSASTYSVIENTGIPPAAPTDISASPTKAGYGIYISWKDNSDNETGFDLWKKEGSGSYALINRLAANTTSYTDSGLKPATTYTYKVASVNASGPSAYIEDSATTIQEDSIPNIPNISGPSAPSNLKASLNADGSVKLSWNDNSTTEKGFKIERNANGSDSFSQVATVRENVNNYTDTGSFTGTVSYRIRSYSELSNSAYSNTASVVPSEPNLPGQTEENGQDEQSGQTGENAQDEQSGQTGTTGTEDNIVLRFYIGNVGYKVNDQTLIADVSPIIKNDRTLLPVRYVATPLGADVAWDGDNNKVTITLGEKKLEMWIGKNTAMVNGSEVRIDPNNPEVMPEILPPGRTMLPLRFIGENLGCDVSWDPVLSEVRMTYTKP